MNYSDVVAKIKDVKDALQVLTGVLSAYEGQIEGKESELRSLQAKIVAVKEEHKATESKASLVLAKASEEAALIRRQANDLLEAARKASDMARAEKKDAEAVIAEAKARASKLESDEKAFNANVIIFERRKQAIDQALRA